MPLTGHDAATKRILADIDKVRDRIRDMRPLMKKIAVLGVASSQKAFRESRLGEHKWDVKYPGQPDPFINIAGAVADWSTGASSPRPVQFDREPPLVGHGMAGGLWGSLDFKWGNDFARWGTNKEYAKPHQEGLETEQTVTPETKQRIFEWFYGKKGERRDVQVGFRVRLPSPYKEIVYEHRRSKNGTMRTVRVEKVRKTQFVPAAYIGEGEDAQEVRRSDYINKFGKLLNTKTRDQSTLMVTRVAKRPFVGMTDELETDAREAIKRHVEEGK